VAPVVLANVDALEFHAPPAGVPKVWEDQHLGDTDHVAIDLGHQHVATPRACLNYGGPISVDQIGGFGAYRERPGHDESGSGGGVNSLHGAHPRRHVTPEDRWA
jgi:hypothetical protein